MAEKRKGKRRKEDYDGASGAIGGGSGSNAEEKPSKEEYQIAKWMKKNVAIKRTKFLYHNVEYFTGSKAVDGLLNNSPWAKKLFHTRQDVADFLDTMLRHKFFHRALKVPVSEEELLARKGKKIKDKEEKDESEGGTDTSKNPKKKKIRLEMHMRQCFEDCLDAYVWIYDPIPLHYWIFGTLLVLGAIGICLFPLWPPEVRKGVYYLSVIGAAFLCFIIVMVVVRLIIFCLVWCLTMGNHHLWLLPNLTEDVGFFASFWPLYHYEYKGKKQKSKKTKSKQSDNEEGEDEEEEEEDDEEMKKKKKKKKNVEKEGIELTEGVTENGGGEGESSSESESGSSQSEKSQTGKDFEIVGKEDVEDVNRNDDSIRHRS